MSVGILGAEVAGDDRVVVQELEKTPAVFGKEDLLLGALDGGGEFCFVGRSKFFTSLERTGRRQMKMASLEMYASFGIGRRGKKKKKH